MKRMLINATQHEELRVALVNGQKLYDLNIENINHKKKRSNIYKGKVVRIEPSLEAIFIDYGVNKHGFLPIKEITEEYLPNYYNKNIYNKTNIKDFLPIGKEIIVQINKEERGDKGASLTTFINLIGSYLILMPNKSNSSGISKKIIGEDRKKLKKILSLLHLPHNMSLIIRTAGLGKNIKLLTSDLKFRLQHWKKIKKKAKNKLAPFLIHEESNLIVRSLRDNLCQDINEILIDDPKILKLAKKHINILGRFDLNHKIKLHKNIIPLFHYYQIESQIETVFQRKVCLSSGGSIVIDTTEALTSIDVNSSKATKGIDIEETALNINLEATDEIIRQLRLRDIGGLIVIDFIDMSFLKNQKIVEKRLLYKIRKDRAKIKIGHISKFGLLEMSRQRLCSSLNESSYYLCPRCLGNRTIRDNRSLSLSILRLIEEESFKKNTKEVYAIVPIQIAFYLLNEKKDAVNTMENRKIRIFIIPNTKLNTPNYYVLRIQHGEDNKIIHSFISKLNELNLSKHNNYYFNNRFIQNNLIKHNVKNNNFGIYDKKIIKRRNYFFLKINKLFNFININKYKFFSFLKNFWEKFFYIKKIIKFFFKKKFFINKVILNYYNKIFFSYPKNYVNKKFNKINKIIFFNKDKIIPIFRLKKIEKNQKKIDNNLLLNNKNNNHNLNNIRLKKILNIKNIHNVDNIDNKKINLSKISISIENKIKLDKFKNHIKINKIVLDKIRLHTHKNIILKKNTIISNIVSKHQSKIKIKNNYLLTKKKMYKYYLSSSNKKIQNTFTNCYNNKLINHSINLNKNKGAGAHAAKRYATSPIKRL
ncbi:Rne/Rng family ribonuclease [Enterobacteriaceae endosymbiont of Donacia versicolorea]|uniref:Rne/Rng family ribonuclease n=1 Tax=Enterobacteriaceae endosymbiont of Donacia versicolorea TaxID=2675788 RepID=UPI001448ED0B|nr:Rne/Rng family ribonuclease [Enterobacteriaceae endosymbiont of Donacia versicolorea]QJC31957.1 Rne/Rng family ribonuclease [Enterobacteriaceae endosymbiont of Donacia versicolorea]